ncbi:MAG: restriction endonuclease [Opitutaceae bacterium]
MPIPDYEQIKVPVLKQLSDGKPWRLRDLFELLGDHFKLTPEERSELLPSGTQQRWHNRVNWACYDLFKANILERPRKGVYQISEFGRTIAAKNPDNLDRTFLRQFPAFLEWDRPATRTEGQSAKVPTTEAQSPTQTARERLEASFEELHAALKQDLLDQVRKMDPYAFEQLVVDLLVAMGYGGSRAEAAQVTQRSGDEGVDGVIKEDRLGLDTIYVQAKRWQNAVGRRELQGFVGALAGQGANKGVFITSGDFATTAKDYVDSISRGGQKIVLIDGDRLAALMIEHGVGVSEEKTFALKRIDSDYFEAE